MKNKFVQYLLSLIIVFASTRGLLVLHFGFSSSNTYKISSLLLVLLGAFSLISILKNKVEKAFKPIHNFIIINCLCISFYMIISFLTIGSDSISLLYLFIIFPVILMMTNYDERVHFFIIFSTTLLTIFGIFYFYNLGITGGFNSIKEANLILHPLKFKYARIGDHLLPGGYQGNHHDAANILVMCSMFFLSKFLLELNFLKRFFYFWIYIVALVAIILTGSVTNIIILLGLSMFSLMIYGKKYLSIVFIILIISIIAIPEKFDLFSKNLYFLEKFTYDQSKLAGGGVYNSLDLNSLYKSLHSILFGFGYVFQVPLIHSEIGFIKVLVQFGVFPFFILMVVCFSPIFYVNILKHQIWSQKKQLIILSLPSFAGVMTLLHYGSLFRVTSIGIFCVLISVFLKKYLSIIRLNNFIFKKIWLNRI